MQKLTKEQSKKILDEVKRELHNVFGQELISTTAIIYDVLKHNTEEPQMPSFNIKIDGGFVRIGRGDYSDNIVIETRWNDGSGKSAHAISISQLLDVSESINKLVAWKHDNAF